MSKDELQRLMADTSAWCKAKRGRQKALASRLGVTIPTLANWLAGRKTPSLQKYLALQAFMKDARL
jgi:transcriptional regulator with XRE-family HTH domain